MAAYFFSNILSTFPQILKRNVIETKIPNFKNVIKSNGTHSQLCVPSNSVFEIKKNNIVSLVHCKLELAGGHHSFKLELAGGNHGMRYVSQQSVSVSS